jgi:AcrR family transcriptional regulator
VNVEKNTIINKEEVFKNKRDEILNKAANLFRKKGFKGTSMQDIAKEVGILKGSIYYYFNSKNEIFQEVLDKGFNPLLNNAVYIFNKKEKPKKKFQMLIQRHLQYILQSELSIPIFYEKREKDLDTQIQNYVESRNKYEKILRSVLEEGIKQGEFPEVDVNLTVFTILGMINWIIQWYNPNGPKKPNEIINYFMYLIFDLMLNNE